MQPQPVAGGVDRRPHQSQPEDGADHRTLGAHVVVEGPEGVGHQRTGHQHRERAADQRQPDHEHHQRQPCAAHRRAVYAEPVVVTSQILSIRRPRRPGALRALMTASGAPARLVTHLEMGSSLRHPILATGRLERRSLSLRPAPDLADTGH